MKSLLFFVLLFCAGQLFCQGLIINEVVFSNQQSFLTPSGDSPDWIELYNSGEDGVSLKGFSMADSSSGAENWYFPDLWLAPKSFLLLLADASNDSVGQIATSFKLSALGEPLYLYDPNGDLIDMVPTRLHATDVSFGRVPDGGSNWGELSKGSPGESNNANAILRFSHVAGFYQEPFWLNIQTLGSIDAEVLCSEDGQIPNPRIHFPIDSVLVDFKTQVPDVLSDIVTTGSTSFDAPGNVFKITTLRCAAFSDTNRISPIYTHSYLIDERGSNRYDYPVLSLVTPSENFFSSDSGIYVPGVHFNEADPTWTGNYFMTGDAWERPVHIEIFDTDGQLALAQDAGARIHGGRTRGSRVKSLRIYARKRYGVGHFPYDFFDDGQTQRDRIVLRTYNACWNRTVIKDPLTHKICRNLDFESQQQRPMVLFINGEYWGMHDFRELLDDHHLSLISGYSEASISIVQNGSGIRPDYPIDWGLESGSNTSYIALLNFMEEYGLQSDENYDFVSHSLDISSAIDYYCAEIFFNNKDWIKNNYELWHSTYPGAKWRHLFFDVDAGWGHMPDDWNLLEHCLSPEATFANNPPYATRMIRHLMSNETFKDQFIRRFVCLLQTTFSEENIQVAIDDFVAAYASGMKEHIERWNRPTSYNAWLTSVSEYLSDFSENRPHFMWEHLEAAFKVQLDRHWDYCQPDIPLNVSKTIKKANALKVYPVPATDVLCWQYEGGNVVESLSIYDVQGRLLWQTTAFAQVLDVSRFTPGAYVLKLKAGPDLFTRRILIQ